MTPGSENRKPLRASGMSRAFFAVLFLVLSVSMGATYWQNGSGVLLIFSVVCMIAAIVNVLVYFAMRSIVKEEASQSRASEDKTE
ncbi:MAG: hypothetical protein K1Y02_16105 [Candidatus Hydrogenedentes bacterium]|nr:hypothetical protein [Candidatus Hydrogenedentota bacterium]